MQTTTKSLTVACVLRSGGPDYRPEHVLALRDRVRRHLTLPHRFICVTDQVDEVEALGITARTMPALYPGWWAKITLFARDMFGEPVLYLDLDTIVVGSLDDLALGHKFTMAADFHHPARLNSSMMAWDCDLSRIYQSFARDPRAIMREYTKAGKWGDQDFIANHTPVCPDTWQRLHPGAVVSYKVNVRKKQSPRDVGDGTIPRGTRVICYHGKPRPWETDLWDAAP